MHRESHFNRKVNFNKLIDISYISTSPLSTVGKK